MGLWGGNYDTLENAQNQEAGQEKFEYRQKKHHNDLVRLKWAEFRGRKRTDKQGAEKYVMNNYILHSFYHNSNLSSFGLQLNLLISQKKNPNKCNCWRAKNPRKVVQGTNLTILQL